MRMIETGAYFNVYSDYFKIQIYNFNQCGIIIFLNLF